VLFFILCYRALPPIGGYRTDSISHGGTVIEDRKSGRFGGLLGPLAAGAGAAALLSRTRSRSRTRRDEVVASRRGSGSYIEEEKYESRKKTGGVFDTVLKGAAVLGAAGLAKSWYDRRQRRKDEEYDSVAPDTPSRRHRRHNDSDLSEESVEVHRMEEGRTNRPILPGPGNPVMAAAALSAAEPRPTTPRPPRRQQSFDSADYSYDSTLSPSRRPQSSHGLRNGLLAGLGLGWFAKKVKDRKDRKDLERLDREEAERVERERIARNGGTPSRLTGDGYPASPRRKLRRPAQSQVSSNLSSIIDDPHSVRPGAIPPIPAALAAGGLAGAAMAQSRSRHDVVEPVAMPPAPPDPHGVLRQEESGSEAYQSAGGNPHRRHSSRRRREGEEAAAAAVAGAAALAAEEEARRRRSRSRVGDSRQDINADPVSVKVKMHGDNDRHVTLRRLTEQEAAAEREARKNERRRRRADSVSSLSGTDTAASRRGYRRDEREAERRAESSQPPPPTMAPLSPPNPAFAGGRRPKDSAYYSGRPGEPSGSGGPSGPSGPGGPTSGLGSPGSHGTLSAMSPSVSDSVDPAERRRRRRAERNQRSQTGTVDFT
jgi:hypothetical protein